MRITYIHQHFQPPHLGGGGRPYEFAKRLARDGHVVTMLAAGPESDHYSVGGFEVIQIASKYSNSMTMRRRLLSFASFMLRSSVSASKIPADVVIASSTPLTVGVPGIVASSIQRAAFVFEVRDLWPRLPIAMGLLPTWLYWPSRLLERIIYCRAQHVIALSPWMESGVRQACPSASTSLIPNASDVWDYDPTERERLRRDFGFCADEIVIYYAGSLGITYDPEWLAEMTIVATRHGFRVVIAGSGSGETLVRTRLTHAGMDPDAVLLGNLPRSEAMQLAAAADVALSSLAPVQELEHNSLNKVFDAFAVGRPILFNHGGWLADLAIGYGVGWRIPRHLSDRAVLETFDLLRSEKTRIIAGALSVALGTRQFDRESLYTKFAKVLAGANDSHS